jgi:hypothetical protein
MPEKEHPVPVEFFQQHVSFATNRGSGKLVVLLILHIIQPLQQLIFFF